MRKCLISGARWFAADLRILAAATSSDKPRMKLFNDVADIMDAQEDRIAELEEKVPKKGRWVQYLPPLGAGDLQSRCSECGMTNDEETPFCPNCGADMREATP